MLTIDRIRTIAKLAVPITIAMSSTMVMSLIDLAMVGALGTEAVAAVGLASFCSTLIFAFMYGLSPAVQGFVARRRGEGSTEPKCIPLNAALLIAVAVGVPLTVVCYLATPFLFSLVSSDPEVTRIGVPYLQILYLAIVPIGITGAFRGFWSGMERPAIYMGVVLFMDALNIVLNYILIYGNFGAPALGATGAAIGTTSALFVGVAIHAIIGFSRLRGEGFLAFSDARPLIGRVFNLGLPATMQEFFFSAGYIVFFWMVGLVGTIELAAASVLVRITMILILIAISLGHASATLVSKSIGEGDPAGAERWGWDVAKVGVAGITLLGLPLLIWPEWFLSAFGSDPAAISTAVLPLQMVALTTGLGSLIYILAYPMVSVGDGKRVMLVSFSTQWLVFLPAVWVVGPYLDHGLLEIWIVQMVYGFLATALIVTIWAGGRWKQMTI
ncbi:MAG: MATE family efflux transporter [Pseudomonadota bacterium]